jgi:hypothetical protein
VRNFEPRGDVFSFFEILAACYEAAVVFAGSESIPSKILAACYDAAVFAGSESIPSLKAQVR